MNITEKQLRNLILKEIHNIESPQELATKVLNSIKSGRAKLETQGDGVISVGLPMGEIITLKVLRRTVAQKQK